MQNVRNARDLKGLWAAVPTPWDDGGRFDAATLERNVERYADIPMDGVYTTDSDGEFYAIELDEFKRVTGVFAKAMDRTDMAVAAGVTWCNTQGIIDRMRVCLDNGIRCFHVAYPFWMPLSPTDVSRFWEDLASAVPQGRWVHYNTPRAGLLMKGKDYSWIAESHPEQLVGVKMGTVDVVAMAECITGAPQGDPGAAGAAPSLAHLGTDYVTVYAMMLGAVGVCSYWANTLPRWTRRMMDLCLAKKWDEARHMQNRLLEWETLHIAAWREAGHLHGIIGKARASLSGWLEENRVSRAPYYPVDDALFAKVKAEFDRFWAGES